MLRIGLKGKVFILIALLAFTTLYIGPFGWVAIMSVRTTAGIENNHYALPHVVQWANYAKVWLGAGYGRYFANSTIVTVASVLFLTVIGSMAGHCLARYRFPGNRVVYFLLFSGIILPPQITVIALYQLLVSYGLYDTLTGLTLVYIAMQLPLTIYLLESFFAQIPEDLLDAARIDGYSEWEIFWKLTLPISWPAVATTIVLNIVYIWNEFLFAIVLLSSSSKWTLPLGIMKFMGDQREEIALLAAGLMIAVIPVLLVYALFSEKVIQGMTAGAVK
ncbi:MAG TPA: carbohydrate ABC transporter permease [Gammaproteobacteria bacterium]|nr:carbohydrate ABC transporter permease [Gammaproteobacteria bacterium]